MPESLNPVANKLESSAISAAVTLNITKGDLQVDINKKNLLFRRRVRNALIMRDISKKKMHFDGMHPLKKKIIYTSSRNFSPTR